MRHLWHALPKDDALTLLHGSRDGLGSEVVAERQVAFGPNELARPPRPGYLKVYLRQFKSPLIYLLLAAAGVSLAIGEMTDALFIFAVLQINAIIGAVQEWKAESSAQALNKMIPNHVTVRRGGKPFKIPSAELVPGDIVLLEAGLLVPADIRILQSYETKADESLLTGESMPVEKSPDEVLDEQTHIAERTNMFHAGSTIVSGRAEGVVTQTGQHTEIGHIANALAVAEQAPPPLVVRLEAFTRRIGLLVVMGVAVLGVVQFQRGMELAEIFFVAVALAVSAIPEGLPVAITVALSVGTARMARRNVIVRSLPAVEGLGACTVIASDKTGTLTCNELTIKELQIPNVGMVKAGGEGYLPEGEVTLEGAPLEGKTFEAVHALAKSGALCNEAGLYPLTDGDGYRHFGDTVDVAFLVLARKLGLYQEELADSHPQSAFIPFESERRFAASFHAEHGGGFTVHVKGAAEVVLPMCGGNGKVLLADADRLAANGYRVLAVASGLVDEVPEKGQVMKGLSFLGFAALIDPVRPEVPHAVALCREAGVDIRMVTGDHPATALAIARELNFAESDDQVVTGPELAEVASDPAETALLIANARVFARVEPLQKLTIVQALQRLGHFVAVTGDGVNDAPALRSSNIGVAMGKEGTDVARGAADLVLADDNFASIVAGVEQGRIAYDNVRKVIYLLVSTGASEIFLFGLAIAAGLPLPLFAAQLLWLNLVTNGIQHVGLAFERGEPGILKRKPRPPNQPVFDRRMVAQTVVSGVYIGAVGFAFYWWALRTGMEETQARNALLMLMVLFENAHVFNCRSEARSVFRVSLLSNPFLVLSVVCAQSIHIGASYVPGLNGLLGISPIGLETWTTLAALALGLILVMEIYKVILRWVEA